MKRPPQRLLDEYAVFRTRFEWMTANADDDDVVQAQNIHAELCAFLDRWQGKVRIPEFESAFAELRPRVDSIGLIIEAKYLEALADLLERRHTYLIAPKYFKTEVTFMEVMKLAPAELRPGLEEIFREHEGYDYDPERFYREIEAKEEIYAAEYKQCLALMEVTWAERFTVALRERLARAPIEEINQWKAEVAKQLAATETAIADAEPEKG